MELRASEVLTTSPNHCFCGSNFPCSGKIVFPQNMICAEGAYHAMAIERPRQGQSSNMNSPASWTKACALRERSRLPACFASTLR